MSEPNSERIITPMSKSLIKAIDDYRFEKRLPSRAEAIRTLIIKSLESSSKEDKNQSTHANNS